MTTRLLYLIAVKMIGSIHIKNLIPSEKGYFNLDHVSEVFQKEHLGNDN